MKNKVTISVEGMHCHACEVLIERKLAKQQNIISAEASTAKGNVVIECRGDVLDLRKLNEDFKKEGYRFYIPSEEKSNAKNKKNILMVAGLALLIIIGFYTLNKTGMTGLVSVSATSSLPAFFLFGLLAGVSSCAALVGGIILSMSKQWNSLYSRSDSFGQRAKPHLLFNAGRLLSYAAFGMLLGALGSKLQLSLSFYSILVFAVSVMMLFLGLQLLGVKFLQKWQIRMPKRVSHYVSDESKFRGKIMPALMGALTFFLPCGFTITAQGLSLLSGSAVQGGLIMLFFALGTLAPLLAIGLSSVKFYEKPTWAATFSKIAGILVLFFALYNVNVQLNVMDWPSLNDIRVLAAETPEQIEVDNDLPPIVNGQQILKMEASAYRYNPNYLKVRAGVPVKWKITDVGTSGCTNAVISRGLFEGEIHLTPGTTSVKEFTPATPGTYKFSCWMGMVSGTLEVVAADGSSGAVEAVNAPAVDSGATGCGGGGSGSCSCSGGCGRPDCEYR